MNPLTVMLVVVAAAPDLKPFQTEAKEAFDKQMKDLVGEVNTECGTKFTEVASDFQSYDKADFKQMSAGQTCSQLTYAVIQTCKSAAYKKAFVAKVKGLACLTAKTDAKAPYEVKDGVFTAHLTVAGGGLQAKKALEAELDK
ncbi:MAG: hypothetical protein JNK82_09175 [Myxococcaceae bacterium]|nr:hypothetical protein [Myxococcaceae bacterium]